MGDEVYLIVSLLITSNSALDFLSGHQNALKVNITVLPSSFPCEYFLFNRYPFLFLEVFAKFPSLEVLLVLVRTDIVRISLK